MLRVVTEQFHRRRAVLLLQSPDLLQCLLTPLAQLRVTAAVYEVTRDLVGQVRHRRDESTQQVTSYASSGAPCDDVTCQPNLTGPAPVM